MDWRTSDTVKPDEPHQSAAWTPIIPRGEENINKLLGQRVESIWLMECHLQLPQTPERSCPVQRGAGGGLEVWLPESLGVEGSGGLGVSRSWRSGSLAILEFWGSGSLAVIRCEVQKSADLESLGVWRSGDLEVWRYGGLGFRRSEDPGGLKVWRSGSPWGVRVWKSVRWIWYTGFLFVCFF